MNLKKESCQKANQLPCHSTKGKRSRCAENTEGQICQPVALALHHLRTLTYGMPAWQRVLVPFPQAPGIAGEQAFWSANLLYQDQTVQHSTKELVPLCNRLANTDHLSWCVRQKTQNANKSFNALMRQSFHLWEQLEQLQHLLFWATIVDHCAFNMFWNSWA